MSDCYFVHCGYHASYLLKSITLHILHTAILYIHVGFKSFATNMGFSGVLIVTSHQSPWLSLGFLSAIIYGKLPHFGGSFHYKLRVSQNEIVSMRNQFEMQSTKR